LHLYLASAEVMIERLIDRWGPPASPNSVFVLAAHFQGWLVRILLSGAKDARKDYDDVEELVRETMETWDRATLRVRYDCQHCISRRPRLSRRETEIEWFVLAQNTAMMAIDTVEARVREALGQTQDEIEKVLSVPHWQRMRPPEVRRSNSEARAIVTAADLNVAENTIVFRMLRAASITQDCIDGLYGGPLSERWEPANALPESRGREIARLRTKLQWTQEGTAHAAGLSVRTVIRAEQDRVSDEAAESILKALQKEMTVRGDPDESSH
jgi:DNA-binding XRE family transcriptional regulator